MKVDLLKTEVSRAFLPQILTTVLALTAGCATDAAGPALLAEPALIYDPDGRSPLAALVEFAPDRARITDAIGLASDDFLGGRVWARIVEVTHTLPAEKVFELLIGDESNESGGWYVTRSERLASLYP